ncbi:MAG: hypothetical protein AABO57_09725 [Acidobacteriota bacterium]
MKGISAEIPAPHWKGDLKEYLQWLAPRDQRLVRTLKTSGLPSKGECSLTATPGENYGIRYKDFAVNSLSVLLGNRDDFDLNKMGGMFCVSGSGSEGWRIWRVWLLEVAHNDPQRGSCIRYLWDRASNGSRISIEHINDDLARSERKQLGRTSVVTQLKQLVSGLEIISMEEAKSKLSGRPEGTGWFKSLKDFRIALKEVLAAQNSRPTQLNVLKLLDNHRFCQIKARKPRNQSHTKLLRHWLHKAKIKSYNKALQMYWKPSKSGK